MSSRGIVCCGRKQEENMKQGPPANPNFHPGPGGGTQNQAQPFPHPSLRGDKIRALSAGGKPLKSSLNENPSGGNESTKQPAVQELIQRLSMIDNQYLRAQRDRTILLTTSTKLRGSAGAAASCQRGGHRLPKERGSVPSMGHLDQQHRGASAGEDKRNRESRGSKRSPMGH